MKLHIKVLASPFASICNDWD